MDDFTIDDLVADPANPRSIDPENEDRLLMSMATYGDLANPTYNRGLKKMVGGHQRIRVLREKYGENAVRVVEVGPDDYRLEVARPGGEPLTFPLRVVDWDEHKHAAAMVAANSPDVQGDYVAAKMRDVMDFLGDDCDVELLGLKNDTFKEWTQEPVDKNAEAPDDLAPAIDGAIVAKWRCARGQVWTVGPHRVMCGDAENAGDVAVLLNGARPNLCITDPPYGVKYDPSWREGVGKFGNESKGKVQNDDRCDFVAALKLHPGDVMYCWCASLRAAEVGDTMVAAECALRSVVVWNKQHFTMGRGNYHWKHELCLYGVRDGANAAWIGGRDKCTVWDIKNNNSMGNHDAEETFGHGTQKPVECMARPMRHHEGDAYDPFAGTGTTLVAAHHLGRKSWMMEIDPDYCAVILERASRLGLEVARAA